MSVATTSPLHAGKPESAHRLAFIDIMRGIACVWMIETHVVNACLSWQYRGGWFFTMLNTSNGYVSVSFIFCAGAGFWLAASRKVAEYKAFQPSLWQYVRRLGFILMVAYWLHVPTISLGKYLIAPPERQNLLWICDVLHTIVIASCIALALLLVVPTLKQLRWVFVGVALVFIYAAPLVWQLEPDTFLPRVLGAYISRPPAAAFPLFPWCAYFFMGAALTAFFMESSDRRKFAQRSAWIACVTPFVVMTFLWTGWNRVFDYGWTDNWYLCSPGNVLFRVSGSILLFSMLYLWQERIVKWSVFGRTPASWLQLMGQESLFVYVFHLMIVYGSPANLGLSYFVSGVLRPFAVIVITLAVIVAVYVLMEQWHTAKKQSPHIPKRIIWAFGVLFALVFVLVTPQFADMAEAWALKNLAGLIRTPLQQP
ncbi:MAG: heparan-alpha-glucosaminide N-acetyltransferase domain-containing protein [Bacteroidota bacterium]|nr:DUF1624 domain-containing protein [Candidatus Kapabacteria bacterium]MDW8220435.1 heparan-alpha-glucosaminide N-acetyltransferase domain-containing protein [Bacteroidota bacterium]